MKLDSIDHSFYIQIQKEINRIEKKSDSYRVYYYFFRISLIVLAGVITVVSGLKGMSSCSDNYIFNIILILGATSAALTSFDTLFQVETKKNTYKLMLIELREIRSEFVYYHQQYKEGLDNRIKEYLFPRYQAIIALSKGLIEKENENT